MQYTLKPNRSMSHASDGTTAYSVRISLQGHKIGEDIIQDLLDFFHQIKQDLLKNKTTHWLTHSSVALAQKVRDGNTYFYLEPHKNLNRAFAEYGTIKQQIDYLSYMGITDRIDRHPELRNATTFVKFSEHLLQKTGIHNPGFDDNGRSKVIRKIHAVHQDFLDDPEITAGLHISQNKCKEDELVVYVCSPETLQLALQYCELGSTLIIDGHWEHEKRSTHGVWESSAAEIIAEQLTRLLVENPDKISDIRLWGCQAGYLKSDSELSSRFDLNTLHFKDKAFPSPHIPNSLFRNRACYVSGPGGEFPFSDRSLAGQIIRLCQRLSMTDISITATPGRTYPYPPENPGQYNIGSDATEWVGDHFWSKRHHDASVPEAVKRLHQLKSISQYNDSERLPAWGKSSGRNHKPAGQVESNKNQPAKSVRGTLFDGFNQPEEAQVKSTNTNREAQSVRGTLFDDLNRPEEDRDKSTNAQLEAQGDRKIPFDDTNQNADGRTTPEKAFCI